MLLHRSITVALALVPVHGELLGILLAGAGTAREFRAAPRAPALEAALSRLALDARQQEEIEDLFRSEAARMTALREALANSDAALRRAELEQPFDVARISTLLSNQAELVGHARGAESRIVTSISALLSPAQRETFSALRLNRAELVDVEAAP